MPLARAMASLHPVARTPAPSSVPKNQYSNPMITSAKAPPTRMDLGIYRRDTKIPYSSIFSATLARPLIIRRFTEYSASWVKIPAKIAGMPNLVCKIPVTSPAIHPAKNANSIASQMFIPAMVHTTSTAPPVPKLPSTVKSAKSRTLKVKYTPTAMIPQMIPWAQAPGKEAKNPLIAQSPSI